MAKLSLFSIWGLKESFESSQMPSQRRTALGRIVKLGRLIGSTGVSLFRLKCISSVLSWLKGACCFVASWKNLIAISFSSL